MSDKIWTEAWLRGLSWRALQSQYQQCQDWRRRFGEPSGIQKQRFLRVEEEWRQRNRAARKVKS